MGNITLLFGAWLIYLVLQAIFINGVKLSAGGTTEMKPDGTDYDSEMILYPLAKELLKKTSCKIFYKGEFLGNLYSDIIARIGVLKGANLIDDRLYFTGTDQMNQFKQALGTTGNNYLPTGVKFRMYADAILFYKEYDEYKYSVWLRKPIIQCVVCMGSFYGLFTFLIPGLIITHFNLLILPAYIVNAFMLACMNKIISKFV